MRGAAGTPTRFVENVPSAPLARFVLKQRQTTPAGTRVTDVASGYSRFHMKMGDETRPSDPPSAENWRVARNDAGS